MTSAPATPPDPVDSCFIDRDAEERLDVDQILHSLAHPRRREILGLLDERPDWTRPRLSKQLSELQEGSPTPTAEEIEADLVHSHLPALEQAELISLDADGWSITRGENYDTIREMAEAAATVIEKP